MRVRVGGRRTACRRRTSGRREPLIRALSARLARCRSAHLRSRLYGASSTTLLALAPIWLVPWTSAICAIVALSQSAQSPEKSYGREAFPGGAVRLQIWQGSSIASWWVRLPLSSAAARPPGCIDPYPPEHDHNQRHAGHGDGFVVRAYAAERLLRPARGLLGAVVMPRGHRVGIRSRRRCFAGLRARAAKQHCHRQRSGEYRLHRCSHRIGSFERSLEGRYSPPLGPLRLPPW